MYNKIFSLHAKLLKTISHPKRLEIIHLIRNSQMSVTDIYEMLDLPQANVSQHLMVLRQAGVVETKKEGKQILYKIKYPELIEASDLMRKILIDQYKDSELIKELAVNASDLLPLVLDPVCGMRVSPQSASFAHKHNNDNYYFCASGCLKKFINSPGDYVKK